MHAMAAWRSCPHAHMSKSTECSDCLENCLLSTTHGPLHFLPFSREELLSHSESGPQSLPLPLRLFLILIKRHQLSCVYLTSFSITASAPQRCNLFYQAPGPTLPAAPWPSPGDGVSVPSRGAGTAPTPAETAQGHGNCWRRSAVGWIPTRYWCRHGYHHSWGGESLKAALQHKFAVLPRSAATYRWMHQTLSEELKYEHKFSF